MSRPSKVTVAGTASPIIVGIERHDAVGQGPEARERHRGEWDALQAGYLANAFRDGVVQSSIRQEGAVGSAEYTFKDPVLIEQHVEFDTEEVTRPWFFAPYYATLTASEVALVESEVTGHRKYLEDSSPTPAEASADLDDRVTSMVNALAGEAIEDLLLNGDSYIAFLPVITYTINASPDYATRLIIDDVGKIYTTVQLSSAIPNLNDALFQAADILNTVTANELQTVGWLKRARMGYSSDGGAQYVQSFRFDAWPTNRYTRVA
jgi:hypothetical protein